MKYMIIISVSKAHTSLVYFMLTGLIGLHLLGRSKFPGIPSLDTYVKPIASNHICMRSLLTKKKSVGRMFF